MKIIDFFKKSFTRIAVIACVALVFGSCKKSDLSNNYPDGSYPAEVEIIHAAAGAAALDVAFDNNRLGVNTFNFTDRIDYLGAIPGKRLFKVFNAGAASNSPIVTRELTFETRKHYSVFIVDTASKMEIISLRDSSRAAGSDSVRIRFANMSPDAPALDLYIKGNTTPVATNITYKNAGNFFSVKSAINIVFELKATGQSVLLGTSDPVNLVNSKIYTIWSGGYLNGNGSAGTSVRVSSFTHNPLYY